MSRKTLTHRERERERERERCTIIDYRYIVILKSRRFLKLVFLRLFLLVWNKV